MNGLARPTAQELWELRQTARAYDGGRHLSALDVFARTGTVVRGLTAEVDDVLAHSIVFGGGNPHDPDLVRLQRLREHVLASESNLGRDRRVPGVLPYRNAPAAERRTSEGAQTSPFMRVMEHTAFDEPPSADASTPPGWVAEPAGRWDGQAVEVVYDPRRHQVMFTSTRSNTRSDVVSVLEAGGWERQATAGSRSFWTRDRLAATRSALARLDQAAATGIDHTNPSPTAEPPDRPRPGGELAL